MEPKKTSKDKDFAEKHLDFIIWWKKHPHNDSDPKYSLNPRIAYNCDCYHQEFLEAKQIGLI